MQHSLASAEKLRSLTLSSPFLRLEAPLHLLTHLTKLGIRPLFTLTAPVLDSILGLTRLESLALNMWRPQYGDTSAASYMEELSTRLVGLTYLDLLHSLVGVPALIHLRNLPNLTELLVDEAIPAVGLAEMDALPITSITAKFGEDTLSHLAAWLRGNTTSRLQKLYFWGGLQDPIHGHGLPQAPVHDFPLHLATQLKTFDIAFVQLTEVHMAAITQLTQLTRLQLRDCGLSDAAVRELLVLSNLWELDLRENRFIKGRQGLMGELARSMPGLEMLFLGGTSTDVQEAA